MRPRRSQARCWLLSTMAAPLAQANCGAIPSRIPGSALLMRGTLELSRMDRTDIFPMGSAPRNKHRKIKPVRIDQGQNLFFAKCIRKILGIHSAATGSYDAVRIAGSIAFGVKFYSVVNECDWRLKAIF